MARYTVFPATMGRHQVILLDTHVGRIHLDISLETSLQEVEARFVVLPITGRACALVLALPEAYPKDPMDRIIAATALPEGLPLLTADLEIRQSEALFTIW